MSTKIKISKPLVYRWLIRYAPSEICGTIGALAGAWLGHTLTGSLAVAALTGTAGENIGYYGYAICREVRHYYCRHYYGRHQEHIGFKRISLTAWHSLRSMIIEYGPAECVDSFFMRPAMLYLIPQYITPLWLAWLIGKVLADSVFYGIAITGHEMHKRYIDIPPTMKG